MAYAVTHILVPIVLVDLYRHHIAKNKFSTFYVLVAGIAGLLPDIDIIYTWIFNLFATIKLNYHGTFTHTLYFPILFLILFFIFRLFKINLFKYKYNQVSLFLFMVFIGTLIHLILDFVFSGGYPLLPPFYSGPVDLIKTTTVQFRAGLDAILLVVWLVYEEKRHKIRDYI